MRALAYHLTSALISTCLQTEVKDHLGSLKMTCSQYCPPTIVGFLDQDYHYELVAIQIPHDAGLAPLKTARNAACKQWFCQCTAMAN